MQLSPGSDGSSDAQPTAQPPPDERHLQWEQRGGILRLSIEFASTVGTQSLALCAILNQVHYSRSLLMSCDSRQVGITVAVFCEYTKAYVRCFPLLAIIVSLIVASRMFLCQRMYYKMLKKGAILDFDNFKPLKDQLFIALLWSAFNAWMHFVLELSINHPITPAALMRMGLTEKAWMAEIHKVASLYVTPSIVFLVFLYMSYDEEARLLPLSKYFEEDPSIARQTLGSMLFLPEAIAAGVVKRREVKFKHSDGKYHTSDEVFALFVKQCKTYVGSQAEQMAEGSLEKSSHVHLICGMWPGRLLLDDRLADDSSYHFRLYWLGCSAVQTCLITAIIACLANEIVGDVRDFRDGQISDLAALIVSVLHAVLLLYLGFSLFKVVVLPYIGAWRKLLKWHEKRQSTA